MKRKPTWAKIGAMLTLIFLAIAFGAPASVDATPFLVLALCIAGLMGLPRLIADAKKKAVPARRSDFIGYGVILALWAAIFFVARAMLR
jgi:hypothetical protein